MIRNQTFHERLIPMLVEGIGAQSYLEFGTYCYETIGRVKCAKRFAVDADPNRVPEVGAFPGVQHFAMTTERFIADFAMRCAPFDVVFIDADHDAEAVRRDFSGIWPYVSDDGLVLLHDTNPQEDADTAPEFCGDSWKFAQLLKLQNREAVTLPYHPGLTIIRKRKQWGPTK